MDPKSGSPSGTNLQLAAVHDRPSGHSYLPSINSARYTQRIIQTVKSREVEKISRPEEIYHDTGTGPCQCHVSLVSTGYRTV